MTDSTHDSNAWAGRLAPLIIGVVLAVAAVYTLGWAGSGVPNWQSACDLARWQLAGTAERARAALAACGEAQVTEHLRRDSLAIVTYVSAIGFWCVWGATKFRRTTMRTSGWVLLVLTVVAGGLDVVENVLLTRELRAHESHFDVAGWVMQVSLAKWVLTALATGYAVSALVACVIRVFSRPAAGLESTIAVEDATRLTPARVRAARDEGQQAERQWWAGRKPFAGSWHPDGDPRADKQLGIAMSGGGIRAASFGLGCLHACLEAGILSDARYLAAVSGGGYLAAGRQMALHQMAEGGGTVDGDAFGPASTELHDVLYAGDRSKYLWRSLAGRVRGIALIVVYLAVNLAVFGALIYLAARPLGWAAHTAALGPQTPADALARNERGLLPIAVVFAIAALLAHQGNGLRSVVGRVSRSITSLLAMAGGIVLLLLSLTWPPLVAGVAIAGTALAALVVAGLYGALRGKPPEVPPLKRGGAAALRTTGMAVLGAAAAWLAFAWTRGGALHGPSGEVNLGSWPAHLLIIAVGTAVVAGLLVWTILEVYEIDALRVKVAALSTAVTLGLAIVAWWAVAAHDLTPEGRWTLALPGLIALVTSVSWFREDRTRTRALGIAAALACLAAPIIAGPSGTLTETQLYASIALTMAFVFIAFDQRAWSPQQFYKERLASAFATTRTEGTAHPMEFRTTSTTLSTWSAPVPDQPILLTCASVALSGDEYQKRPAGAFTFSYDVVGGPDVGWMPTADLEAAVEDSRIANDVTLQAAMSISGAAVASATGYSNLGSLNALIAMANARLGVWVPSPTYVHELFGRVPAPEGGRGSRPRIRRLGYSLKEVFGIYDFTDRFVYVSDGGHRDNLGLLELLRRRCRWIICFDASHEKDASQGVETFDDVRQLAGIELGVTFMEGEDAPALHEGRTTVATYEITYPALTAPPASNGSDMDEEHGTLIFAKCRWLERDDDPPDDPPDDRPDGQPARPLSGRGAWPNDSTGRQWFDAARVNAYRDLGEYVAAQAINTYRAARDGGGG